MHTRITQKIKTKVYRSSGFGGPKTAVITYIKTTEEVKCNVINYKNI